MIAVAGMTEEDATKALEDLGLDLNISVVYEENGDVEGRRCDQRSVETGTRLSQGGCGYAYRQWNRRGALRVPDVYDKSLAEAVSELEADGFQTERNEGYSDTVAEGNVMSQSPEGGTRAERGSTVTITISQGPQESKGCGSGCARHASG